MKTAFNLYDETERMMQQLQNRGLTPEQACRVMGLGITALISDKGTARSFVRSLAKQLEERAS